MLASLILSSSHYRTGLLTTGQVLLQRAALSRTLGLHSRTAITAIDAKRTTAHMLECTPYAVVYRYWDTRPTAVITRITQLMFIAGTFISGLVIDVITGEDISYLL